MGHHRIFSVITVIALITSSVNSAPTCGINDLVISPEEQSCLLGHLVEIITHLVRNQKSPVKLKCFQKKGCCQECNNNPVTSFPYGTVLGDLQRASKCGCNKDVVEVNVPDRGDENSVSVSIKPGQTDEYCVTTSKPFDAEVCDKTSSSLKPVVEVNTDKVFVPVSIDDSIFTTTPKNPDDEVMEHVFPSQAHTTGEPDLVTVNPEPLDEVEVTTQLPVFVTEEPHIFEPTPHIYEGVSETTSEAPGALVENQETIDPSPSVYQEDTVNATPEYPVFETEKKEIVTSAPNEEVLIVNTELPVKEEPLEAITVSTYTENPVVYDQFEPILIHGDPMDEYISEEFSGDVPSFEASGEFFTDHFHPHVQDGIEELFSDDFFRDEPYMSGDYYTQPLNDYYTTEKEISVTLSPKEEDVVANTDNIVVDKQEVPEDVVTEKIEPPEKIMVPTCTEEPVVHEKLAPVLNNENPQDEYLPEEFSGDYPSYEATSESFTNPYHPPVQEGIEEILSGDFSGDEPYIESSGQYYTDPLNNYYPTKEEKAVSSAPKEEVSDINSEPIVVEEHEPAEEVIQPVRENEAIEKQESSDEIPGATYPDEPVTYEPFVPVLIKGDPMDEYIQEEFSGDYPSYEASGEFFTNPYHPSVHEGIEEIFSGDFSGDKSYIDTIESSGEYYYEDPLNDYYPREEEKVIPSLPKKEVINTNTEPEQEYEVIETQESTAEPPGTTYTDEPVTYEPFSPVLINEDPVNENIQEEYSGDCPSYEASGEFFMDPFKPYVQDDEIFSGEFSGDEPYTESSGELYSDPKSDCYTSAPKGKYTEPIAVEEHEPAQKDTKPDIEEEVMIKEKPVEETTVPIYTEEPVLYEDPYKSYMDHINPHVQDNNEEIFSGDFSGDEPFTESSGDFYKDPFNEYHTPENISDVTPEPNEEATNTEPIVVEKQEPAHEVIIVDEEKVKEVPIEGRTECNYPKEPVAYDHYAPILINGNPLEDGYMPEEFSGDLPSYETSGDFIMDTFDPLDDSQDIFSGDLTWDEPYIESSGDFYTDPLDHYFTTEPMLIKSVDYYQTSPNSADQILETVPQDRNSLEDEFLVIPTFKVSTHRPSVVPPPHPAVEEITEKKVVIEPQPSPILICEKPSLVSEKDPVIGENSPVVIQEAPVVNDIGPSPDLISKKPSVVKNEEAATESIPVEVIEMDTSPASVVVKSVTEPEISIEHSTEYSTTEDPYATFHEKTTPVSDFYEPSTEKCVDTSTSVVDPQGAFTEVYYQKNATIDDCDEPSTEVYYETNTTIADCIEPSTEGYISSSTQTSTDRSCETTVVDTLPTQYSSRTTSSLLASEESPEVIEKVYVPTSVVETVKTVIKKEPSCKESIEVIKCPKHGVCGCQDVECAKPETYFIPIIKFDGVPCLSPTELRQFIFNMLHTPARYTREIKIEEP